ncbi:MAG TPA: anti-sigma factor [Xanthobacteraceae bacterium]|nr:anti-sigma factor [Xanthobacteraceae bacterium]
MTHREPSITDEELHAYIDGMLPADRLGAVEAYVAAHPEVASRVAAWRAQAAMIRERWGKVAEEKIPERLLPDRIAMRAKGFGRKIAAAATIAFVLGTASGWFGRDYMFGGRDGEIARALADAAIEAHRIYVVEVRHPIEVRADEAHLVPWLSRRVGQPLKAPDLEPEGLKLLGGRLLSGPHGIATAFFMYEGGAGERVTLTTARTLREGETAFQWRAAGDIGAVAWIEGGLAFVVAGPAERARLDRVARRVFDAYEVASSEQK